MATNDNVLIHVAGLNKHYNRGTIKALDGVDIDIHRGEVVVVIGPSGSGKSTFLRSLNLMEEPTGGEIIFNGVDITKKKIPNAEGKMVKKVVITTTEAKYTYESNVNGSAVSPVDTTITWEGDTDSFEAIMEAGQVRIKNLTIVAE